MRLSISKSLFETVPKEFSIYSLEFIIGVFRYSFGFTYSLSFYAKIYSEMFWKLVSSDSFSFFTEFLIFNLELAPKNGDWTFLALFCKSVGTFGSLLLILFKISLESGNSCLFGISVDCGNSLDFQFLCTYAYELGNSSSTVL